MFTVQTTFHEVSAGTRERTSVNQVNITKTDATLILLFVYSISSVPREVYLRMRVRCQGYAEMADTRPSELCGETVHQVKVLKEVENVTASNVFKVAEHFSSQKVNLRISTRQSTFCVFLSFCFLCFIVVTTVWALKSIDIRFHFSPQILLLS